MVKSRLQAATHKYKSSLRAVLDILNKEGVSGTSLYPLNPIHAERSSAESELLFGRSDGV